MRTFILILAAVCCLAGDRAIAIRTPDLPGTGRTCADAKRFVPVISCEPDGSYTPRQCQITGGLQCVCVDPQTGARLSQHPPFPPTNGADCNSTFPDAIRDRCPVLDCDNMCQFGRVVDRRGCRTCDCILGAGGGEPEEGETECDKIGCPSIFELVKRGCTHRCLMLEGGCPACNQTCIGARPEDNDECTNSSDCDRDQICLSKGIFGRRSCVDLLDEGDECGVSVRRDSATLDALTGTSFEAIARGSLGLNRANIPCKSGFVCARVNLTRMECIPERPDGPCIVARMNNEELSCSADGYYSPLQCRSQSDTIFRCFCVTRDGTEDENTAVFVADRDDAPNCEHIVFEGCSVEIGGQTFEAMHGSVILIPTNCSRCICFDGEAQFCMETDEDCSSLLPDAQQSCMVEGMGEIRHGQTFMVDCNFCRCLNGRVSCTHTQCEEKDERTTSCIRCRFSARNPVCGPDGRTYQSECYATECVGLSPAQLSPGACARYDVCDRYPCEAGEMCLRKGGVSCFNLEGCRPSDARICLNPANLICEGGRVEEDNCDIGEEPEEEEEEEEDDDMDYICSTNGRSYRSICRMLQDTAFTAQVAHNRRCNARICRGGPICGTDGVTYENLCLLRSQSGSGRADYNGSCDSFPRNVSVEDVCNNIRERARCQVTTQNCRRLVRPEEGCCPVCGGSVIAAIDGVGLRDYIRLNPSQQDTLDALLEQLVPYLNISDRCELEGTLTSTGNLEMILMGSDEYSEFCYNETQRVAEELNNGGGSREARPPLLQYVSAAVTAPLVEETDGGGNGGGDGGNGSGTPLVASTALLLFIMIFSGLIN